MAELSKEPDARMLDRLLLFSDAVFAIVLTLLAIELHAPHVEHGASLWAALGGMSSQFFAFGFSFALIGLWWSVHMRNMRTLVTFDWPVAIANLLVLACVTLLPFATSVFGENPGDLERLQFYWWISLAISVSNMLLFILINRGRGKLVGGATPAYWWFRFTLAAAPAIAFAFGIYFCATGQEWPARFAAFIMFPIMLLARVFKRSPKKTAKA
jgi:uncharacterized membrane protein